MLYSEDLSRFFIGISMKDDYSKNVYDAYTGGMIFDNAYCSNMSTFRDHSSDLFEGAKLYITNLSKIPRTLVRNKYKIVKNPVIADFIVTPAIPAVLLDKPLAIFAHQYSDALAGNYFYISEDVDFIKDNNIQNVHEYYKLKGDNTPHCAGYTLFYAGNVKIFLNGMHASLYRKLALLPCNIKEKIIFDYSLLEYLEDNNQITKDSLDSIVDMIDSTDKSTVKLAFVTLSTMNYYKFPVSMKVFMDYYYTSRYGSNSSIDFMRKYLDGVDQDEYLYKSTPISKEDFEMLKYIRCKRYNIEDPSVLYWSNIPTFE